MGGRLKPFRADQQGPARGDEGQELDAMDRKDPAMPDAEKKKEEVDLDRADPAGSGGWFFLKGTDTVRLLRAFARWDAGSRVLGLLLLGACAFYLRELVSAVLDLALAMKGR